MVSWMLPYSFTSVSLRHILSSHTRKDSAMQYKKFGNTDMNVSTICLGTWVFGGSFWGGADDNDSDAVVKAAIDKGINFIDTAPAYGAGHSEEVIGRAIKGMRGKVFIATKCGLDIKGNFIKVDLSAAFVRQDVETSLMHLGVETIDLIQCHWSDPKIPIEETLGEFQKLAKEGKVRHFGVSNFDKELIEKAAGIAPIASQQAQYSIFDRRVEKEMLPFCLERNIAFMPYGALGGGILSGKYKNPPNFPKKDARSMFYTYYREPMWSKCKELVKTLEGIASKRKVPVSQVAINWVLSNPAVPSCIVGCRTVKQLEENAGAADWSLSSEELGSIQGEYQRIFGGTS